jgi:hypothetical protein
LEFYHIKLKPGGAMAAYFKNGNGPVSKKEINETIKG